MPRSKWLVQNFCQVSKDTTGKQMHQGRPQIVFPEYPPSLVLTRARFWFRGQNSKHGVAVFVQACVTARHLPRNTCCRHKPTLPLHNYKRVSNRPAYTPRTQEHMELQLHQHFDTHIDPSCSLHKATNRIPYWIRTAETMIPKRCTSAGKRGRRVWTIRC